MKQLRGFTLIEALITMVIATIILAPFSIWFYQKKTYQLAYEKTLASGLLQKHMHRIYMEQLEKDLKITDPLLKRSKLNIKVIRQANEIKYSGEIKTAKGQVLAHLVMSRYEKNE